MSTIHRLRLRFSNAYLVVGERPVLIDTGSRGDAARITAGCAAAGVDIRDLSLILHTHVHSDHFGNTAALADLVGCPIAYHPGDGPLAAQGHNGRLRGVGLRGRMLAGLLSHLPFPKRSADIDATDGMRLDGFGVAGRVLHTPGHTPGSISVVLDSGDAIVGDLLMGGFAGGVIRPTRPMFHYFADDLPAVMTSVGHLLAAASARLCVGHGGPLAYRDVAEWHERARKATRDRVA